MRLIVGLKPNALLSRYQLDQHLNDPEHDLLHRISQMGKDFRDLGYAEYQDVMDVVLSELIDEYVSAGSGLAIADYLIAEAYIEAARHHRTRQN